MYVRSFLMVSFLLIIFFKSISTSSLFEQLQQFGYAELKNDYHGSQSYDDLYKAFDQLIDFFKTNPVWVQKLYCAKERFIRSKDKVLYGTDFLGWYDDSLLSTRHQISFYYSIHFHQFLSENYPDILKQPNIQNFFQKCFEIQRPCNDFFKEVAQQLGLDSIFLSTGYQVPILLKVIKYFEAYNVSSPHYDGTAFTLFLDSTDNQSLLLSPYKSMLVEQDFFSVFKNFVTTADQSSMLLIPGTLLTEFFMYPTPHIVQHSGQIRYATVAFAMRPNFIFKKREFTILPNFKSCTVS